MSPETPFGPVASAYSAFRPTYPRQLYDIILAAVPPERRLCAMDLGAGTGQSARPLLEWFERVIAVEADARMAEELRRCEPRIEVRVSTAEECQQPPESLDLVTSATAFYWMDGALVLANAARWLRPGGVLAIYRYHIQRGPSAVRAIFDRELTGNWMPFRHPRLLDHDYTRRTLAASPFSSFETHAFEHVIPMTVADILGFIRSTSYGGAYMRALADPEAYLRGLEAEFARAFAGARSVPVTFPVELYLARKPL
jgi:SAM-dependent methyltransferase